MWTIPSQSSSLRLLTHYVRLVSRGKCAESSALDHAIATHMLDLIALSVGADRDAEAEAEERGVRAARLEAIKADISSRLSDRDLSVTAVAARHGVTPRYVHKLFETEGASFSEFVRARRLKLARRLLTDPRFGAAPLRPSRSTPASRMCLISTARSVDDMTPRRPGRGPRPPILGRANFHRVWIAPRTTPLRSPRHLRDQRPRVDFARSSLFRRQAKTTPLNSGTVTRRATLRAPAEMPFSLSRPPLRASMQLASPRVSRPAISALTSNPHSARGPAATQLPATSCLGAFWTPAA